MNDQELIQRKPIPAAHEPQEPLLPECRICFDSEESENNKLFRPCLCKGTQAFVHEECLNQWRATAQNQTAFYQCSTCGYQYRVTRIWYASLFINPISLTVLTLLVILLTVTLVAYSLKTLAFVFLGVKMGKNIWALSSKLVLYAMALIGFITFIVALFDDANAINIWDFHIDPFFWDSTYFTGLSYSISALGFVIFIKKVYKGVEHEMKKYMTKVQEKILEGHVE